eukprot:IDg12932t1
MQAPFSPSDALTPRTERHSRFSINEDIITCERYQLLMLTSPHSVSLASALRRRF